MPPRANLARYRSRPSPNPLPQGERAFGGGAVVALILALIVGIVLFVVLLKILLFVGALVIGLFAAVIIYFAAEKLVGQGR